MGSNNAGWPLSNITALNNSSSEDEWLVQFFGTQLSMELEMLTSKRRGCCQCHMLGKLLLK
jgi:hypothetical protein